MLGFDCGFPWKRTAVFLGGVLFGTAGISILKSKDAKKVYTHCTAAVLRGKDAVVEEANARGLITITAEDLHELVTMKKISDAMMDRIRTNYRFIIGFNGLLISLGVAGILTPSSSALLHNTSTVVTGLYSMTPLLKDG